MKDLAIISETPAAINELTFLTNNGVTRMASNNNIKLIPLTQGYSAIVDVEDFEWLMQWKWTAYKSKHTVYAGRSSKIGECEKRTTIFMHREILKPPNNKITDHKNNNGLDNQRLNLRSCTYQENTRNLHTIYGKSKYKGVVWRKREKKWSAQIRLKDKLIHLGYFHSEIDAALAYNDAAKKYFGEFAWLNNL